MAQLEREELDVVTALVRGTSLSRSAATLAVVMATRSHARPRAQLLQILSQYPELHSGHVVEQAVGELEDLGWMVESGLGDISLLHQAPDLRHRIAEAVGDPGLTDRLARMRAALDPYIKIVGPMKDGHVYETFLWMLRQAEHDINLPMLVTPPYGETVEILEERAAAGVRVRILLGTPELAASIRGRPMAAAAEERIEAWKAVARHENITVRLSGSAQHMRQATSVLIDGRLVRFDIYDPMAQRSLEGVMIEVESPSGWELNFVSMMFDFFEDAWQAARPLGGLAVIGWRFERHWKVVTGFGLALLAVAPVQIAGWREILAGMASGLFGASLVEARSTWFSRLSRLWRTQNRSGTRDGR